MRPRIDAEPTESDPALPEVTVELFGVPRLLTGQRELAARGGTLAEVARDLAVRWPVLRGPVIDPASAWLVPGYAFVVNERFTADMHTVLGAGSTVLLVSSVAGG